MNYTEVRELLGTFPQVSLGVGCTPLHRLRNLEAQVGHTPIFAKRDDLNGLGIGGNKVRNLEFLLGDALDKGADTVVVSGMCQSNFCSLAAAACRKARLNCVILHNEDQPPTLAGNMLLNHLLGADQRFLGRVDSAERETQAAVLCKQMARQEGKKPYLIPNGASTALGCLGYVQMAAELAEQIASDPAAYASLKSICVPGGNGGLAAGILFGAALLQHPFHVELISVEYDMRELLDIQRQLWTELIALVGVRPDPPYAMEDVATLHEEFRCGGWGLIDDEVVQFLYDFARTEGFFVEKVYTGKTLYGMVQLIKRGHFHPNDGVCFLHSGGMAALFAQF